MGEGRRPGFKGYIEVAAWKCKGGGLFIKINPTFFLKKWEPPRQEKISEDHDDTKEEWEGEENIDKKEEVLAPI